jgi:hypothetical protein
MRPARIALPSQKTIRTTKSKTWIALLNVTQYCALSVVAVPWVCHVTHPPLFGPACPRIVPSAVGSVGRQASWAATFAVRWIML